jgi:hypothetical protein
MRRFMVIWSYRGKKPKSFEISLSVNVSDGRRLLPEEAGEPVVEHQILPKRPVGVEQRIDAALAGFRRRALGGQ